MSPPIRAVLVYEYLMSPAHTESGGAQLSALDGTGLYSHA